MNFWDASDFMTRNHCGAWGDVWIWSYIVGNLCIGLSYFAIPVILLGTLAKHRELRARRWLIVLFSTFIFFCGGGHILDGVGAFVWPNYRFFALWHCATALVSFATATVLPIVIASYARGLK
jgi:hypothetical protein